MNYDQYKKTVYELIGTCLFLGFGGCMLLNDKDLIFGGGWIERSVFVAILALNAFCVGKIKNKILSGHN